MNVDVVLRAATAADVPEILRQRRAMYVDMGYTGPSALDGMVASSEAYLRRALADGSLRSWLAIANKDDVAGGGVVIVSPWLSHPYDLQCRQASILNVYVYPSYRRQGIARRLMQAMIEWCRAEKFAHVSLHASPDGRALYESLGFQPNNEMRLKLR